MIWTSAGIGVHALTKELQVLHCNQTVKPAYNEQAHTLYVTLHSSTCVSGQQQLANNLNDSIELETIYSGLSKVTSRTIMAMQLKNVWV